MDSLELECVSVVETANLETIKAMAAKISPMITEEFQKNVLAYLMINDRRSRLMEDELAAVRETLSEIKKSQSEEGTLATLDNSLSSNAAQTNSKRHVYAEVHFEDQKYEYVVDTGTKLRLDAAIAPRFVATIVIEDRHTDEELMQYTVSGSAKVNSKKYGSNISGGVDDSRNDILAFPKLTEQIIYKIVCKKFYADGKKDADLFKAAEDRLKMVRQKIREVLNYKKKCQKDKASKFKLTASDHESSSQCVSNAQAPHTPISISSRIVDTQRKRKSTDFQSPPLGSSRDVSCVAETPKSRRFSRRTAFSTTKLNLLSQL